MSPRHVLGNRAEHGSWRKSLTPLIFQLNKCPLPPEQNRALCIIYRPPTVEICVELCEWWSPNCTPIQSPLAAVAFECLKCASSDLRCAEVLKKNISFGRINVKECKNLSFILIISWMIIFWVYGVKWNIKNSINVICIILPLGSAGIKHESKYSWKREDGGSTIR